MDLQGRSSNRNEVQWTQFKRNFHTNNLYGSFLDWICWMNRTRTSSGSPFNAPASAPQGGAGGDVSRPPAQLELKLERADFKRERSSPEPDQTEPDQTEPVDLSLNKPRPSSVQAPKTSATVNPAPGGTQPGLPAMPVPSAVQSIGSMVTQTQPPPDG